MTNQIVEVSGETMTLTRRTRVTVNFEGMDIFTGTIQQIYDKFNVYGRDKYNFYIDEKLITKIETLVFSSGHIETAKENEKIVRLVAGAGYDRPEKLIVSVQ